MTPSDPNSNPQAQRSGQAAPIPPDSGSAKPLTVSIVRKTSSPDATEKAVTAPTTSSNSSDVHTRSGPRPEPGLEPESSLAPQPAPLRRRSATDRIAAWLARPVFAAPAVIACLSVLGWSVFIRRTAHPLVVHARPSPVTALSAPSVEEVAELARQATVACTTAVTNVDQLPRLISQLEQQARAAGFLVEVTTHPPQTPVPGVPELSRHPLVLKLDNTFGQTEPAFHRFLNWLHHATTMGLKVEPGAVTLQSPGLGLSSATVELGLFSFSPHAKAPSE